MISRALSKIRQVTRVSSLASSVPARWHFILSAYWLAIRHRLPFASIGAIPLALKYRGKKFYFYAHYSTDIATLEEIFINEDYHLDESLSPKLIFDVGSNTGVSIIYLRLRYPNATIYAFEADPKVFTALQKNAAQAGNVKTYNYAITDTDAPVTFFVHPKSNIVSSLIRRFPEQVAITVAGKKLDSVMRELDIQEIDFLKFDIEGAEYKMLRKFDTGRIGTAIGELHTDLAETSKESFSALFSQHKVTVRPLSSLRYIVHAQRA